ncbi:MAG: glutathione S-transferase family protein [Acidimicrobiaceae bacterium]|jgi:glutathione S-transferase
MSSSPVTLFGHWICPFSVRVEFALAQREIDYVVVDVPPRAVRPKGYVVPEEFITHSPKLEVPMVKIDGEYLADSIPILEWLEEKFTDSSLLPADDFGQAVVRERVEWMNKHVYRPMIGVYYGTDAGLIQESSAAFMTAMETLDQWLQVAPWLAGEAPTLAEAIMVGVYTRLDGLGQLGLTGELPASVQQHLERCTHLVGWETVRWTTEQTSDFVGRFLKYREIQNAKN